MSSYSRAQYTGDFDFESLPDDLVNGQWYFLRLDYFEAYGGARRTFQASYSRYKSGIPGKWAVTGEGPSERHAKEDAIKKMRELQ